MSGCDKKDGASKTPPNYYGQTDTLSVKFTIGSVTVTIRPDER